MDVLHITQTKNLKSIMKYGILRTKPLLDQYETIMEEEFGEEYDVKRGMVFGIPETIDRRDKYIKDFLYWKTWGDKRNIFLDGVEREIYDKYQEIGPKVFSHIKITPAQFTILLINIPHHPVYDKYAHAQYNSMGVLWSDMDTRYEHYRKPLVLVNYDIGPQHIKHVIGTGETRISRNEKIEVSLKMKKGDTMWGKSKIKKKIAALREQADMCLQSRAQHGRGYRGVTDDLLRRANKYNAEADALQCVLDGKD